MLAARARRSTPQSGQTKTATSRDEVAVNQLRGTTHISERALPEGSASILLLCPASGGHPWRLHTGVATGSQPHHGFSRRLRSELQRCLHGPGFQSPTQAPCLHSPLTLSVVAYSSVVIDRASARRRCRAASKSITLVAMAAL